LNSNGVSVDTIERMLIEEYLNIYWPVVRWVSQTSKNWLIFANRPDKQIYCSHTKSRWAQKMVVYAMCVASIEK
jgi:hypothetical protein